MESEPSQHENSLRDRLNALSPGELAAVRKKLSLKMKGGAALVAEGLHRCGVKRIIGITGAPVDAVFSECCARGIRLIGARHQQSAVLAAASANYMAGRLESAVVVSAGPGVTNTLTGLLVARDNGWPVIVIGGRSSRHQEGIGHFQELDAVPVFTPVTKWADRVDRTSEIPAVVTKAFETAVTGRPGPVYLDIPGDVLEGASVADSFPQPRLMTGPDAASGLVEDAARLIRSGSRPLMILGEEIRWSFSVKALERMAGEFGIPFITAPMGRGFLSDDHPLCANDARRWIQARADVVLMAGAWFDWRFRFGAELGPHTRVIHVDIDPRTLGKNIDPALKIHADSGRFLSQLANALAHSYPGAPGAELAGWHTVVKDACGASRKKRAQRLSDDNGSSAYRRFYQVIQDALPTKSVVVLDGGINLAMGQAILLAKRPCSWLDPGRNGCMGTGIPFGIGAKLVAPDHLVVVVCGDYSFGLSAIELETAVRHKIPIVVIVANNNGINGAVRQKRYLPTDYPELFSEYQPSLGYEKIMEGLGGHAEWVDELGAFRPALDRAVSSGLPACVNVCLDQNTPHPGSW